MNLNRFTENYKRAKSLSAGTRSFLKYLFWVYRLYPKNRLNITLNLSEPVRHVELNVRPRSGADFFIFSEVFLNRVYEVELSKPPLTILDLGANIGFSSIYLHRLFPQASIASVEPESENFELLNLNIQANKVPAQTFKAAVIAGDESPRLIKSSNAYGHQISSANASDGEPVQGLTMPDLLQELNWKAIDLLKLDIEGYEKRLLQTNNQWLTRVNHLLMEIHEEDFVDEATTLLKNFGLHLIGLNQGIFHFGRIPDA